MKKFNFGSLLARVPLNHGGLSQNITETNTYPVLKAKAICPSQEGTRFDSLGGEVRRCLHAIDESSLVASESAILSLGFSIERV